MGATMQFKVRALTTICTIAATLFVIQATAKAATLSFDASLSGVNEVPPNTSPGTGFVTVVLDTIAQTLQINASFSGLSSNDTAAHIHCCAPLGTNAGVATTLPAFAGFPVGVTSGTFNATFSLTDPTFYNPTFVTLEGGTVAGAEAALIAGIEDGQSYFNIHTTMNPGGEIRGQLEPTPLPAALPLFATGLGALALLGLRRKRKATAAA
jgi:CHRD domain